MGSSSDACLYIYGAVAQVSICGDAQIMGIEPAAFHTTMVLGHWSKVARIKEAGLWRGEPNSSHYGHGNDAENFLAMDLVMPQVSLKA